MTLPRQASSSSSYEGWRWPHPYDAMIVVTLVALTLGGCHRSDNRGPAHRAAAGQATAAVPPAPAPEAAAQPSREPGFSPAGDGPAPSVAGSPGSVALAASDAGTGDAAGRPLEIENPEPDPRSKMVTIRVLVEPAHHARISWGRKDLGPAPLEIERPRGSGPLDLIVRAPGYLTVHTRVFTDRDDRVAVRLVPEAEAPAAFGYRPPAVTR